MRYKDDGPMAHPGTGLSCRADRCETLLVMVTRGDKVHGLIQGYRLVMANLTDQCYKFIIVYPLYQGWRLIRLQLDNNVE